MPLLKKYFNLRLLFWVILSLSISASHFQCSKINDSEKNENESENENLQRIKSIQENYRKKIKDVYHLENSSQTKEEAVEKFLMGIMDNKSDLYSCSKTDYLEVFLPNSVDEKTLTSQMEPEKAWEITLQRRKAALANLERILLKRKFKVNKINWKRLNRKLNSLNSHQISSIEIKVENKSYTIEEIKLVIEANQQYKVCVYAK